MSIELYNLDYSRVIKSNQDQIIKEKWSSIYVGYVIEFTDERNKRYWRQVIKKEKINGKRTIVLSKKIMLNKITESILDFFINIYSKIMYSKNK